MGISINTILTLICFYFRSFQIIQSVLFVLATSLLCSQTVLAKNFTEQNYGKGMIPSDKPLCEALSPALQILLFGRIQSSQIGDQPYSEF